MSEREKQSIRYWTQFSDHLRQRGSQLYPLAPMKSDYKHYRDFQIGIPNFAIRAVQRLKEGIGAVFIIKGRAATTYYNALMEQQAEIHSECGEPLSWYAVESEKRIAFSKVDANPIDERDWQNQHQWLANKFETLDKVFRPRTESLKSV